MKRIAILVTVALLIGGSCTTSKITSSWRAPNVGEKQFKKILVVGIMRETERPLREKMEDHMVGDLKLEGFYATSALQEYGPKEFENLSEKEAILKMRNSGIDAVVTIVMLDKKRESRYVAGSISHTPYSMYYNRFYGYYSTVYDRIYMPDYYSIESTKYFWESNLYDLEDGQLMYSVQTQSFDPNSVESLGHEYGKLIVKKMVNENVLYSKNTPRRGF